MQNFGVAGTVAGVRPAHESAKEVSIFDSELMDMRRGDPWIMTTLALAQTAKQMSPSKPSKVEIVTGASAVLALE
jgi:hypothetical protein